MDIKQLNYFKTIVEQGGISAAARALQVAQPVLSRALQALEAELGQTLLIRSKSGIELTVQGKRFYQRIRKLIADYNNILDNPFGQDRGNNGLINYGRTKYWTSWPLTAFHDAVHESNGLEIESSIILDADQGFEALMQGELDILLAHDKKWANEQIELVFQGQFPWGLYLNEKVYPPGSSIDLQSVDWLAWADKDDFLSHQLEADSPLMKVKYLGGHEDLMAQKNSHLGLIIPNRLKLAPADFSLRASLPFALNLLIYARKGRYDPAPVQALKQGLEARW